ncbi:hypothetical protein ACHWQZ_G006058 [Mnemiopsis leidyi]
MADKLSKIGFNVPADKILSPITAVIEVIKENKYRPYVLVNEKVRGEFDRFDQSDPDIVVVGDAEEHFTYENMNKTFKLLVGGDRKFFCLGKGKYYKDSGELNVDLGCFVVGLEYSSQVQAEVIGKPSPVFFNQAASLLGMSPRDLVMIGDDVEGDVGGSMRAGLQGILVKTGKFREKDASHPTVTPTSTMSDTRKVTIIGSGNWGSAIAKIVGSNTSRHSDLFDKQVRMWVFEEEVDGQKLSHIINTTHENVKYLPGITLPENVLAVPDVVESVTDADILVWVLPHQFVKRICSQIKETIKPGAVSLSCIKGLQDSSEIALISTLIREELGTECSVLMGANIANEVAKEEFSEATIGCNDAAMCQVYQNLFTTSYFRTNAVQDKDTVELCGALKNIVAVAAGFIDGLGLGGNTKAAIIRIGLNEMKMFCKLFSENSKESTFFESCGVADLITTCYGGRNRKVSEAFVKSGKSLEALEAELLGGQKLQGPMTAKEVYHVLQSKGITSSYPLFRSVYEICYEDKPVKSLLDNLSLS